MVGGEMTARRNRQETGALEIIEQAVHLLRLSPASVLATYYIGSLPFILGLLYFWADMSRNGLAQRYCTVASLGLAMLFVWMKFWHAVFGEKIRFRISNQPHHHWPPGRIVNLAASQSLIHSTGLLLLPVALLMAVPFGWTYAFYQNVSLQDNRANPDLRTVCKKSWQQAVLWPGQNHILLLVFSMFGLFVFLNLATGIFLLPHMLKKLLGIETLFTMSGFSVLNTTFLAATFGITYLCMDPLIKTVYVLRCFYGSSLKSGVDIKTELRRFFPGKRILAAMLALLIWSAFPDHPMAREDPGVYASDIGAGGGVVSPEELDRSIGKVISQREYAWRMPRDKPVKEISSEPGPILKFLEWLVEGLKTCAKTVARWMGKILDFFEDLLPEVDRGGRSAGSDWMPSVRGSFQVLLVSLVVILGIFFLWLWKKHRKEQVAMVREAIPSAPDLRDDQIKGDELPTNRWLALARELMEKGSLQLSFRAFYFATLAHLAKYELITIAKHKSNRDYERELRRRGHEKKGLPAGFAGNVQVFDRTWYGLHEVTLEDLELFAANQERIMTLVEE